MSDQTAHAELGVTHNDDVPEDGQVWDEEGVAECISQRALSDPVATCQEWIGREWLPGKPGETVLDVGCGDGNYSLFFAEVRGMDYVGVDNSYEMLKLAESRHPDAKFVHGRLPTSAEDTSGQFLPFGIETFDLVFCSQVLHHLPESGLALLELARVARKYLVVHQRSNSSRHSPGYKPHRTELRGVVREIIRRELSTDVDVAMAEIGEYEKHVTYVGRATNQRTGETELYVDAYYVFRFGEG